MRSEQQVLDCSHSNPNNGCGGGHPAVAYQDIVSKMPSGLMTFADYPYKNQVITNLHIIISQYE